MVCDCRNNCNCELSLWVNQVLKNKNLKNTKIEVNGTSEKGDGYISDITFINVSATNSEGINQEYHLVLKRGKKNEVLRKNVPIQLLFEREIFVYNEVFPAFRRFQEEKKLNAMDFVPKCFGTFINNKNECIFFQNLKELGYDLHDKCVPMNASHLKLTMEAYGQYHALSFALRDQKKDEFSRRFVDLQSVTQRVFVSNHMGPAIDSSGILVCDILKEKGEWLLLEKYKEKIRNGALDMLKEILSLKERKSVFIHGDCWNNNYMFKYENKNDNYIPTKVAFLDFQAAELASPVFDLSYHIYSVCSENELQNFDELLNIYYSTFSSYMRKLGSNPDKLFPYSLLVKHWKNYSGFVFIISCFALPIDVSEKENFINLEDCDERGYRELIKTFKGQRKDSLYSRITAIVRHFLEYKF